MIHAISFQCIIRCFAYSCPILLKELRLPCNEHYISISRRSIWKRHNSIEELITHSPHLSVCQSLGQSDNPLLSPSSYNQYSPWCPCRNAVLVLLHGIQTHGKHGLWSLHPVVFNMELYTQTKAQLLGCIDEVQHMERQIDGVRMSGNVEASSNIVFHVTLVDHTKVGLEPVHECAACLAYISFLAIFASNAIFQISAFPTHIALSLICLANACGGNYLTVI